MEFWESRERVIAILDSLQSFAPEAFVPAIHTPIPNAFAVIDGEPMNYLRPDDLPLAALPGESSSRSA